MLSGLNNLPESDAAHFGLSVWMSFLYYSSPHKLPAPLCLSPVSTMSHLTGILLSLRRLIYLDVRSKQQHRLLW